MLIGSGEIHIPPETYVLGPVIRAYRRYSYLPWAILVDLVLAKFEYHPQFEHFGVSLRPLSAKLRKLNSEHQNLATILDELYRFHAESCGVQPRRWGDKTPLNAYAVDDLFIVFPQAQFIHVLRDGVDVVHSMIQTGLIKQPEDAAARWLTAVRSITQFASSHPTQCIEIRYEALVRNPVLELTSLGRFLDLDVELKTDVPSYMRDVNALPHHSAVQEPITTRAVGLGRHILEKEVLSLLDATIGDFLEELGYQRPLREGLPA